MTVSHYLFSTSLPQGLYCAQRLAAATTEGWGLFYSHGCGYNSRMANYMTVILAQKYGIHHGQRWVNQSHRVSPTNSVLVRVATLVRVHRSWGITYIYIYIYIYKTRKLQYKHAIKFNVNLPLCESYKHGSSPSSKMNPLSKTESLLKQSTSTEATQPLLDLYHVLFAQRFYLRGGYFLDKGSILLPQFVFRCRTALKREQ